MKKYLKQGFFARNTSLSQLRRRSQLTRHITSIKYAFPFHKDWNCHAFRHSFAYNFLKRGGEMYELMAILGHKSIGITINLYGRLRSEDVEDPSPFKFD